MTESVHKRLKWVLSTTATIVSSVLVIVLESQ